MNKFRLHPLFSEDGDIGAESGVEVVPAAEVQTETPQVDTNSETGALTEVAAEPEKQNNFEKAFAKRLAAKEAEWQKEMEKYKDYDTHRELSDYFQKINGMDALNLKERIELEKLQERAEQANVPPEVMKRLDELEVKAAKADELEQKQQFEQATNQYFSTLEKFVSDKGVSKDELNQFMIDEKLTYDPENMERSFNIALKAFKAEQYEAEKSQFEAQKDQFKKDAVKEYLDSKKAPRAEGTGSAGIQSQGSPKNFSEAEERALARIRAANTTI